MVNQLSFRLGGHQLASIAALDLTGRRGQNSAVAHVRRTARMTTNRRQSCRSGARLAAVLACSRHSGFSRLAYKPSLGRRISILPISVTVLSHQVVMIRSPGRNHSSPPLTRRRSGKESTDCATVIVACMCCASSFPAKAPYLSPAIKHTMYALARACFEA